MKKTLVLACLVFTVAETRAQFSGFISATTGYHQNPLYNYEQASDQLKQTYLELNYAKDFTASTLKFSYISGLMIFNKLTDRNYYEHNFLAQYGTVFQQHPQAMEGLPANDQDREEQEEEELEEQSSNDTTGSFLNVALKVGARHDKSAFKEFDNLGSSLLALYRIPLGGTFYAGLSNTLDYHRYVYLDELSNVTNTLAIQLGSKPSTSLTYGLRVGAGLKHFTSSLYDTTRFEPKRTYVLKPAGKGKLGAKIKVPSTKQILVNPESNNIAQFSGGTFLQLKWPDGSAGMEILYRRNPGSPSRYLAQYANTSILNEDIYNDHFSYEGPETQLRITQALPFGLQSILTLEHQQKKFGAPAVNLVGDQIAEHRLDRRSHVELYLSKYVELSESLGLDIALGSEVMRNQSNDDYNDYSLYHVSLSLGLGF